MATLAAAALLCVRATGPSKRGTDRGSDAAKRAAAGRATRRVAVVANTPQPDCWPVATIGHTCASSIVEATPAIVLPQV
jgi:hypothetical protein